MDLTPPLDSKRSGFTNHIESLSITTAHVQFYNDASSALARDQAPRIVSEAGCTGTEDCFREIARSWGRRIYRRPLTDAELAAATDLLAQFPDQPFAFSVELLLRAFLQSPHFIHRPEFGTGDGELTPYEVASRLSYFIWGSMPDDRLLNAADRGQLIGDGLRAEVDRMLADPRAREGLVAAAIEWLEAEKMDTRIKDPGFPWSEEIRASLRRSLEEFIWTRGFGEDSTINEFLTASGAYVDRGSDAIFGTSSGDTMTWVDLPDRSGVLTQPAVLAGHGYGSYPSPVLRGVFLLNELLCDPPQPPPPDIPMSPPPTEENGTPISNRRGYEIVTESSPGCLSCHMVINPLGFAFENYDTVGRWQDADQGGPIDASGDTYGFASNIDFDFQDARELTSQMATSRRVRSCIVDRWIRYATGSGALSYDPCFREDIEEVAMREDASLRDVVLAIALHPKFSSPEMVR